jgi:hypothetical protein
MKLSLVLSFECFVKFLESKISQIPKNHSQKITSKDHLKKLIINKNNKPKIEREGSFQN